MPLRRLVCYSERMCRKYQDAVQFRSSSNAGRSARGIASVCEEDQRIQQAVEVEWSSIPSGGRGDCSLFHSLTPCARNHGSSKEPRRRGGQSAGSRAGEIRCLELVGVRRTAQFAASSSAGITSNCRLVCSFSFTCRVFPWPS
jgi:hypothetical protein